MTDVPLVVIVGPTGSGKTSLSLNLAREFNGEIVSCDSVAVYRDFEIGTAKPSRDERASVPHHLIDVADPLKEFTAGEYARVAREALRDITSRSKLPIVVGGTGLYLRAPMGYSPGRSVQRICGNVCVKGPRQEVRSTFTAFFNASISRPENIFILMTRLR
jgi:tRNA dimethylallyltransferase